MASGLDQRQLGKSVQELAVVNGNEPPPRYIIRDGDHKENIDGNASFSPSIPTVNLQLLSSPSTPGNEKEAEMEKLGSALLCWGFFQAVGHGIPSSLLDEIRNVAKGFFDLPMEEKLKYSKIDGGVGSYGTDETVSEDQVLNWSDRLQFLVQPENQRNLCFWPDNPVRFRFNYYPPCSRPEHVYGIKPHTDASVITIVLQDTEVEGLQVLKDGQWIKVPIVPYALLINLGDMAEIVSNGIFKSPLHRVLTNSERERISLAMFYLPEDAREIEPADVLIDEVRPKLFRKITVKEYAEEKIRSYQQGKSGIDWAKA